MVIVFMIMDLNEQVDRMKQMMGINDPTMTALKRRLEELPKYVRSTYTWLNPHAFNSFEEFIDRTAFTATRDLVAQNFQFNNSEELYEFRTKVYPLVQELVYNQFYKEIEDYYKSHK